MGFAAIDRRILGLAASVRALRDEMTALRTENLEDTGEGDAVATEITDGEARFDPKKLNFFSRMKSQASEAMEEVRSATKEIRETLKTASGILEDFSTRQLEEFASAMQKGSFSETLMGFWIEIALTNPDHPELNWLEAEIRRYGKRPPFLAIRRALKEARRSAGLKSGQRLNANLGQLLDAQLLDTRGG